MTGLSWWRSGWESACWCGGHGFGPWSGRIPHAAEQLDLWATVTEPARLQPVLRSGRGRGGGRPAHRDEEWPPLATAGESPRAETKTQQGNQSINKKSMTTLQKCFTFVNSDNLIIQIIYILALHILFQASSIGIQINWIIINLTFCTVFFSLNILSKLFFRISLLPLSWSLKIVHWIEVS